MLNVHTKVLRGNLRDGGPRPALLRAAREIGTVTLKTKSQPPQEITGKYAVVWRKVGGNWKLATDIWNTNK